MSVYEKILQVMSEVEYLKKDGFVETGYGKGYKALTDEKVLSVIRPIMVKHRLVMIPVAMVQNRTDEQVTTEKGTIKMNRITSVDAIYRIVDVENPKDYVEVASCGTGVDTQDKGSGKAMTYSKKYALLNTFLVPSGDDTDSISSEKYTEQLMEEEPPKRDRTFDIKVITELAKQKAMDAHFTSEGIVLKSGKVKPWDKLTDEEWADTKKKLKEMPNP